MKSPKIAEFDRMLAGFELASRILLWLVMFVPCAIWFLVAAAFDALARPDSANLGRRP